MHFWHFNLCVCKCLQFEWSDNNTVLSVNNLANYYSVFDIISHLFTMVMTFRLFFSTLVLHLHSPRLNRALFKCFPRIFYFFGNTCVPICSQFVKPWQTSVSSNIQNFLKVMFHETYDGNKRLIVNSKNMTGNVMDNSQKNTKIRSDGMV